MDGFLPEERGGTVSLRTDGRVRLDYEIRPEIWEALREGQKALARIQLAAGAIEIDQKTLIGTGRDVRIVEPELLQLARDDVLEVEELAGMRIYTLVEDRDTLNLIASFIRACDDRQFRVKRSTM